MKPVPFRVAFSLGHSTLASFAALLPLALSACEAGVVVHGTPPPPTPPPPVVWDESEPNDAAWLAAWFGSLYAGESILVEGYSCDDGSDPQDGLAFTGFGPCRIDVRLSVDDPWTDLDVWVYDADLDEFVTAFALPYGTETGTFWLEHTTNFHLVVVPRTGASWWTLEVSASSTAYYGLQAADALPERPESLRAYSARGRARALDTLDASVDASEASDERLEFRVEAPVGSARE